MRFAWVGVLVLADTAIACPTNDDAFIFTAQQESAPSAYAIFARPPLSAPFEMGIRFCDIGFEDLEPGNVAKLTFDAIMPAHQHGMNYVAKIAGADGNAFEVSNIVFHMPGRWQITLSAQIDDTVYRYEAEVDVE